MTYSNGNGNGSAHDRDDDYYSWEAEVLRSEDLDTEVNDSPAKDATIQDDTNSGDDEDA